MNGYKILMALLFFIIILFLLGLREKRKRKEELENAIRKTYGQKREDSPLKRRDIIAGFYREKVAKESGGYHVDDLTWSDLEMDRVFASLNHTCSFMGEEYLYYRLRTMSDERELVALEQDILSMENNPKKRERLQMALASADKSEKYSLYDCFARARTLPVSRHTILHAGNLLLFFAGIVLLFTNTAAGILTLILFTICSILSYFKIKALLAEADVILKELLRLTNAGNVLLKELKTMEKRAGKKKISTDEEDGETLFPEQAGNISAALKELSKITDGASKILGKDGRGLGAGMLGMDYLNMLFHFDQMVLEYIFPLLLQKKNAADMLFENLGYIDFVISITSWRKSLPYYCLPVFDKCGQAVDAYHPLLNEAVPNSYCFDRPVLLTGSNASGKSTFLRTVALNMLLSQTLHTAAAKEFHTTFCRIYTSMSLRDDMKAGDSYFMAEIKAMKRIIEATARDGKRTVFFVDEVLRGTNTVERIAASSQILAELSKKAGFGIAATHDIELTQLLENEYGNYHFSEELIGEEISFDYKIHAGRANSRNAIGLLKQMGYGDCIVNQAERLAKQFMETGKWI